MGPMTLRLHGEKCNSNARWTGPHSQQSDATEVQKFATKRSTKAATLVSCKGCYLSAEEAKQNKTGGDIYYHKL